jgi:hypothetical protein
MLYDRLFRKFVNGYFNLRVDGWVFGSNLTHGPQKGLHSFGDGCIILQRVGLMIQPGCFMGDTIKSFFREWFGGTFVRWIFNSPNDRTPTLKGLSSDTLYIVVVMK